MEEEGGAEAEGEEGWFPASKRGVGGPFPC